MSSWAARLKNLESGGQGTDKTDKSPSVSNVSSPGGTFSKIHPPSVSNVSSPPPAFENIECSEQGAVIRESQAQMLSPSPSGNDIEAANSERILVTAYTPNGLPMLVEADSPEHAEWIVRANPPPVDGATATTRPNLNSITKEIRNPGIPADLFALAMRYCTEVYGDGQGAIETMLGDLQAVPDDWDWWRQYFAEKLAIPEAVRCDECRYCTDTGSGLGRCEKGVPAPGGSGLWWMADQHPCVQFSARQEAA